MGRMINIDELWKELEILYDAKNGEVTWNDALWKIKRASVVESNAQQWIPCSERLPEDGERVLATHLGELNPDRQVIEHVYANGKFTMGWHMDMNIDSPTFGQRYMGKVIAWMPLPEPWRGEEP